jgi:hypothetical protein
MCRIKSAIVLKDSVYMPFDHDHHTKMLEELGIKDDSSFPNFVRIEITPIDNDIFNHNLENWKLKVDQDIIPDWFDIKESEERAIYKLQEWFEKCFVIDRQDWNEYKDVKLYVKNSKVRVINSSVVARENSSVVARENSSVVAWENSSVVAWENSSVVAWGKSSVVAWENSSVEAWGKSSVEAWGKSSVVARGKSSVVARENSSVVAWENSSVVAWENSSVVAWGKSQILIPYSKNINIKSVNDKATIKDLSDIKPKLIIANDFEIVKFKED